MIEIQAVTEYLNSERKTYGRQGIKLMGVGLKSTRYQDQMGNRFLMATSCENRPGAREELRRQQEPGRIPTEDRSRMIVFPDMPAQQPAFSAWP